MLFAILISSVGCGSKYRSLPKRPSIDLCAHVIEADKVYCVNNQTNKDYELHLEQTDRYVMMSPSHWGLVKKYIEALKGYSPRRVRKELNKLTRTSKSLYGTTVKRKR